MSEHAYRIVGCNRPEADPVICESWDEATGYIIDVLHAAFPDGGVEALVEEITTHEPALGAVWGPDPDGYVYFIDRAP